MSLKGFVIDVKEWSALIKSYGLTVSIDTRQRRQFLTKMLLASQETVLFPHSKVMVLLVSLLLPNNRDFLFHPATQANLTLFTHIVDYQTLKVLIKNACNKTLCILCRHKLGDLINIIYDNCFITNTQSAFYAIISLLLLYQHLGRNDNLFSYQQTLLWRYC